MKNRCFFLAMSLLTLASCGGGGGGSDAKFAGVWFGTVSLVGDDCGVVDPSSQFVFFTHLVNQDDHDIVLDNGLLTFSGDTDGSDGFHADVERAHAPLVAGSICTEKISWRYESVKHDTAQFVVRSSTITCITGDRTEQCQFAFSGSASRSPDGSGHPGILEDQGSGTTTSSSSGNTPAAETSL